MWTNRAASRSTSANVQSGWLIRNERNSLLKCSFWSEPTSHGANGRSANERPHSSTSMTIIWAEMTFAACVSIEMKCTPDGLPDTSIQSSHQRRKMRLLNAQRTRMRGVVCGSRSSHAARPHAIAHR